VGIYVGREGRLIECNKAFKKMFGYTDEELKNKTFLDFVHPDDHAMVLEKYRTKYPEEEFPLVYEVKAVNKKGEIIYVEISVGPYEKRGKVIGIEVIHRDISERKKIEEELKESEERFRNLYESIPDSLAVYVGKLGRLIEYNRAFKKEFGYTNQGLKKDKFFLDFVHPDYHAMLVEAYRKELREEELPFRREILCVNKEGKSVPTEISVGPYKKEGRIVGINVMHRDISERKAIEEKLRESEERFRTLFESIQDPVGIFVGREGRLVDYNTAFKKLSGYTDEELKNKIFLELVHPDDQALVLEKYRTNYSEEDFPIVYEMRAMNKKGETIPLEISVSPFKKKGRVIGIEIVHRDITERKAMERKLQEYAEHLEDMVNERTSELKESQEALRESEERLKQLIEYAPDSIFLFDSMGNFLDGNKQAEEIVGYKKEELIGKNMLEVGLLSEENVPKGMKSLEKLLSGQRTELEEQELIRKDGKTVYVEISAFPVKRKGKVENIGIARNITERKRMEERLLKSERMAAIGELATMVGHDLRNPLAAIQNACYYLKMKLETSKDKKIKKMFTVIGNEVDHANNIVKGLMDFSGARKPDLMNVDIIASIQDAVAQLKFPENVILTTKFSEVPTIEADPDQLRRVFQNLALNGAQAMSKGGELTISTRKDNDFVDVAFTDKGVGIPKENMGKLFTPLFTTKAQGVGLGLAICKNFVESHNGRIEVKSKAGEGSTFTVRLPIHQNKGGEK
jgi:PAS domain S-box-containing protein